MSHHTVPPGGDLAPLQHEVGQLPAPSEDVTPQPEIARAAAHLIACGLRPRDKTRVKAIQARLANLRKLAVACSASREHR